MIHLLTRRNLPRMTTMVLTPQENRACRREGIIAKMTPVQTRPPTMRLQPLSHATRGADPQAPGEGDHHPHAAHLQDAPHHPSAGAHRLAEDHHRLGDLGTGHRQARHRPYASGAQPLLHYHLLAAQCLRDVRRSLQSEDNAMTRVLCLHHRRNLSTSCHLMQVAPRDRNPRLHRRGRRCSWRKPHPRRRLSLRLVRPLQGRNLPCTPLLSRSQEMCLPLRTVADVRHP